MKRIVQSMLVGTAAGAVGTIAMTVWMKRMAPAVLPSSMLPREFPPRRVVEWAEDETAGPDTLPDTLETSATMAMHFGYGTGWGAPFGLVRERTAGLSAPLAGLFYGVALWAIGYEGWLPALGIQRRTTEKPPRQWPFIVVAHLVYGATTALTYDALRGRRGRRPDPTCSNGRSGETLPGGARA